MKVDLVAYTEGADHVCNLAAKNCVSGELPELFEMDAEGYPYLVDSECKSLEHALASGHESVAEHATFTFAIEGISRACSHQLVRHRMASYSQQSQRYVKMDGFEYVTPIDIEQAEFDDREGIGNGNWGYGKLKDLYDSEMKRLASLYSLMVEWGVSGEDARYILPNACCTNIVVTVNARELLHMASERMCTRAQWEIREMVTEMVKLAKVFAPTLFENAGPKCMRLGYCPERKGCGRYPPKEA